MDYQSYEDYMRNVLGYSPMNSNIYNDTYDYRNDYYFDMNPNTTVSTANSEELNMYYPEIYKIVYPMVCKICNQNQGRDITKDMIESMTEEIYTNIEDVGTGLSNQNTRAQAPLKNGDVRNPNAKEPEVRETRQSNFLLRDLIKILILREFGRPQRPPYRPPMPPRPPHRPPMPPRNPWGGMY